MLEREIKLFIPAPHRADLLQYVQQFSQTQSIELAAQYYDTPQRCLAQRYAALRLRREGQQWIQTLKMRGTDELSHLEYNHPRPEPSLDLQVYQNTPAATLFAQLAAPLEMRYETHVQRTLIEIRQNQTLIEIALDNGEIRAKQNTLPIHEVEFELKQGEMAEVFALAEAWLVRFHLLLELRTKSERGDALYEYAIKHPMALSGQDAALALAAQPYRLPSGFKPETMDVPSLYYQGASLFLSQVIRNAAFLAGVDDMQAPPQQQASYLTLMRVGMRRLRSCRQLFKPWLTTAEVELTQQLRKHYKAFGQWRDKDMLWLELQPKLIAAGLPAAKKLDRPHSKTTSALELAASTPYQKLLLQQLRHFVLQQSLLVPAQQHPAALAILIQRLQQLWQRIQHQSHDFLHLNPSAQHDLRNQIKQLRYNLELFGYSNEHPFYATLAKAQDHLGDLCDAYVAYDWYTQNAMNKAQKQFAQTWLKQKIQKSLRKSQNTLVRLNHQRATLSLEELIPQ